MHKNSVTNPTTVSSNRVFVKLFELKNSLISKTTVPTPKNRINYRSPRARKCTSPHKNPPGPAPDHFQSPLKLWNRSPYPFSGNLEKRVFRPPGQFDMRIALYTGWTSKINISREWSGWPSGNFGDMFSIKNSIFLEKQIFEKDDPWRWKIGFSIFQAIWCAPLVVIAENRVLNPKSGESWEKPTYIKN